MHNSLPFGEVSKESSLEDSLSGHALLCETTMHFHSHTNLDLAHGEIDPVGPQLARLCDFSLQESLNTFISCLCGSKCQLKLLDVSPVSLQSAVRFLQDTIKAHNDRIIQKRQSRQRCSLSDEELVLHAARKHPLS